ncbi:MAG TPA: SDR family oxidoreductase [Gammaproteobacteria bacterium]|nr:SDR family oxidoreductase [Gammaproteobacteria bacterium]
MKLIIFGATGSIGSQLVRQALEQGHSVTAFTRDPAKLTIRHDRLVPCQGDVLDPTAVEAAIAGHDAVLCSLGAGRKGTVRAVGTRRIIDAMQRLGVQRLICQSTLGVGESWGNLNAFWKYFMFGFLLRPAYRDHVQQESYVWQSHLDWTVVRPGAFTDGERTDRYRYGFPGTDRTTKLKISRADVASFMLKQLADNTYLHRMVGLSY